MANRLLRYELTLFRTSFAEGFARKRDRLLLLLVAIFALFWLGEALGRLALPPLPLWLAALAVPPAFVWHRQLRARLAWLREHSAVAPAASEGRGRRSYLLWAHSLLAVPLLAASMLLGPVPGPLLALLAYAGGVGLAALIPIRTETRDAPTGPSPQSRRSGNAVLHAILRRQTLNSRRPGPVALLIVAATFALTMGALWLSRGQSDAVRLVAPLLPPLLALPVTCRLDAELIGFLPYAGRRAFPVGLAVSALPAAALGAAAAAILIMQPRGLLALLAILILLLALVTVAGLARAWLYPGRSGRAVDWQVQIEFTGLALIAAVLPPVALAALGGRLWWLQRRYSRLLWTQL